ncbi:MAG: RNA polymerase sigma factor [Acidimicrobiales bacterium]
MTTLEAFRNGEPQAVHAIYGRYRGPVFAVAVELADSDEAADEATAVAFEATWRAASAFGSDRELSPWLFGFVVRGAQLPVPDYGGSGYFAPAWALFEMRRALDDLQTEERLVLEYMYLHREPGEAIAARIDAPTAAVELIAGRAKHRLAVATGQSAAGAVTDRAGGMQPPESSLDPGAEKLLGQSSTWAQPSSALDEATLVRVADAVSAQPRLPSAPGRGDRHHLTVIAVVAALFLLVGLAIALAAIAVGDGDASGVGGGATDDEALQVRPDSDQSDGGIRG